MAQLPYTYKYIGASRHTKQDKTRLVTVFDSKSKGERIRCISREDRPGHTFDTFYWGISHPIPILAYVYPKRSLLRSYTLVLCDPIYNSLLQNVHGGCCGRENVDNRKRDENIT